jgi:acyl carrier protein
MTVLARVARVFQQTLAADPAKITPETAPDDVPKWDSLGHMAMVSGLEKEFGVQFEVDEIMEMATVGKVVEVLTRRELANA